MKDAVFRKLFKHPVTLQEKGLCGCLCPIAEINLQIHGLFWLGRVKILPQRCLCQSWFILSALHIPASPGDYHYVSWSCKHWVNYHSKWYNQV